MGTSSRSGSQTNPNQLDPSRLALSRSSGRSGSQPNLHQGESRCTPSRSTSTVGRSGSQTNLNQLDSGDRRTAYGASRRSEYGNTPSRKLGAENAQKVIEILQLDGEFYQRLNLGSGSLKSLTAKQFLEIIFHFMGIISGKSHQDNTEADILIFLQNLKYPRIMHIKQSHLKAPNTPHAYPECVAMLAWLSDFVRFTQNSEFPYSRDEELPNADYTEHFSKELFKAFSIWNEKDERKSAIIEQNLIDGFISVKMKNRVRTMSELEEFTREKEAANVNVELMEYDVDKEKRFKKEESEYQHFSTKSVQLEKSVQEKEQLRDNLSKKHFKSKSMLETKQRTVMALKKQILQQKYQIADLKRTEDAKTSLAHSMKCVRNELMVLRSDSALSQTAIARLFQKRNETIHDFNIFVYKIQHTLSRARMAHEINVPDLHIDPKVDSKYIEFVGKQFVALIGQLNTAKQKLVYSIERTTECKENMEIQSQVAYGKFTEWQKKFLDAQKQLISIQRATADFVYNAESNKRQLEQCLDDDKAQLKRQTEYNNAKRARILELNVENEEILEDGEREVMQLFEMKERLIDQLDELNAIIENLIEQKFK